MSDPLDDAALVTYMLIQEAMSKRLKVPEKTGFCFTCEEPTVGAFCCTECREYYDRVERMNAIRGNNS